MNPVLAQRLAKKVLGEDLHAEAEPFYHECFIDMYKVMVSLFLTPPLVYFLLVHVLIAIVLLRIDSVLLVL
jgi:hypothetical protein